RVSTRARRRSIESGSPAGIASTIASFRVCPAITSDSSRRMRVSSGVRRSTDPVYCRCGGRVEGPAASAANAAGLEALLDGDLAHHAHLLVAVDRAVELVLAGFRQIHGDRS